MKRDEVQDALLELIPQDKQNSPAIEKAFEICWDLKFNIEIEDPVAIAQNIYSVVLAFEKNPEISAENIDVIYNDMLIDIIDPTITKTRIAIFNSREAPFRNYLSAREWIYRESALPIPEIKREQAESFIQLRDRFIKMGLAGEIWSGGSSFEIKEKTISFPGIKVSNKSWRETAYVGWSEKLLILWDAIQEIKSICRLPEYAITAYILSGMRPVLPKYEMEPHIEYRRLSANRYLGSPYLILKLYSGDINFDDFRNIYMKYRSNLKYKRKNKISKKYRELYLMVKKAGGVPKDHPTNFWRKIMAEWNQSNPSDKYSHWESVQIAYKRIKDKYIQTI